MAIVVKINGGNTDFEPVSEGVHPSVLADIVDLGMVQSAFGAKHKVRFVWVTTEKDEEGRAKYLFKRYTLSLHEKSNLRKDVKRMRGGVDIEGETFDIETLLGTTNNLVVQHSEGTDGKVYANVESIMKASKTVAIPADFVRSKDKEPKNGQPKSQNKVTSAGGGNAVASALLAPPSQPISDDDIPF